MAMNLDPKPHVIAATMAMRSPYRAKAKQICEDTILCVVEMLNFPYDTVIFPHDAVSYCLLKMQYTVNIPG